MIEHGTLNSGLVHQRCCSVPEGVKIEARAEEVELLAVTTAPLRKAMTQSAVRSARL
jgi:hypothetical protein